MRHDKNVGNMHEQELDRSDKLCAVAVQFVLPDNLSPILGYDGCHVTSLALSAWDGSLTFMNAYRRVK